MVYGLFQSTQRAFVKHVLVLFVIILTLIPVVKAEEKSWYEIDGIKFTWDSKWAHIRPSNTEPIIRIFIESYSKSQSNDLLNIIKQLVNTK